MHAKTLLLFLLFGLIFAVIGFLYSVPAEAIAYAFLLCAVLGMIVFLIRFVKFRKKYTTLYLLKTHITEEIDELPEAEDIREEAYTQLIRAAAAENRKLQSEIKIKFQDMDDYYALWVHQIKTPIAAMNLLLQKKKDGELSEQLFRIEQYADMALTYIRCDSGSTDYVLKNCSLDAILKSCVKKYSQSFIRKKLPLHYTETGLTVLTDEKWLSFVVEQLLSNAIKYTRTGSVSIYAENRNQVVIEDTGIGIAPEDLPRVCEKGYTGYNGRLDRKSTGIGLFLSKKILDSLGHTLRITSEEGKGTRAVIGFPQLPIRFE